MRRFALGIPLLGLVCLIAVLVTAITPPAQSASLKWYVVCGSGSSDNCRANKYTRPTATAPTLGRSVKGGTRVRPICRVDGDLNITVPSALGPVFPLGWIKVGIRRWMAASQIESRPDYIDPTLRVRRCRSP